MSSKSIEVFEAIDKDEYAHVETPVEATEITPIQKEINEIMLLSEQEFELEQKRLLRKVRPYDGVLDRQMAADKQTNADRHAITSDPFCLARFELS